MGQMVEFDAGAGQERGYLALPEGGGGPGVLVLHAWWGLTPLFAELCDQLAGEGYVAFAPDLNAGQVADTVDGAKALMRTRDGDRTEAAAFSGLDYLRSHGAAQAGPLGVIGFSMGAAWALILSGARPDDVGAVVVFYGLQPADFSAARAAYLGHFAEQDEWEPLDDTRLLEAEIRAAGRDVTFHIYPQAEHWFFESDRPEYQPEAAAQAWQRTLDFLRRQLGS